MYRVGTDLEALDIIPLRELLTSIVNHCVLSVLFAALSQNQNESKTKEPPDFVRGSSNFRQDAMIGGDLSLFSSKIACFLWS